MAKDILFPEYNFRVVNFFDIFKSIEVDISNELFRYNLHENTKLTQDIKRVFQHHIIHGMCTYIISYTGREKNIIYYNIHDLTDSSIIDSDKKLMFIENVLFKICKILPIRLFVGNYTYKEFYTIARSRSGKRDEIIANIRHYIESTDFTTFTFSKVRNFTKKNGLLFLNKDYFTALKTKQLLMM